MFESKPFPRPRNNGHKIQGTIPWNETLFEYELYLTHGMSPDSAEGRNIIQRITKRQRNGKPCFPTNTEEMVRKNLQGSVSGFLFVQNKGNTDRASCSLQWKNYCGLFGGDKVWIFDLCRTYEGAKGPVSPTGPLFALVEQFAQAATHANQIYLMVSKADPKEEKVLLGLYNNKYGFRQIRNVDCEVNLQRDIMKKPIRHYRNNVFAPAYGHNRPKNRTYKGGKSRKLRRTYKRLRRNKGPVGQ
jgi:hypothetical protein